MNTYWILWIIVQFIIIYFVPEIVPALAIMGSFALVHMPVNMSLSVFEHFIIFCHHKMFQSYLVFSVIQFWNQSLF